MAINNKLNVLLTVSADTRQAYQNINELSVLLNQLSSTRQNRITIDHGQIQQATEAARQLQQHLSSAINAKTGKLDLTQLNNSLANAGTNVTSLSTKLLGAGVTGQQAFTKLAQAIATAQAPTLQLSKRLKALGTTLVNTIKWQVSSSLITGFTSTVSNAINYTQKLNGALTDIRIVTGYSADAMADFTKQANIAAQALSTTAYEYSKAALIFYQQGLDEGNVERRVATTIKMANVTGQSVSTISDQLTAIWNNFYDGSKSLEYYADVITALGAATASSTDEIAQGLEKFAAIADTVGLSYEYATAALATVTAETRQSADVVGTAFKTMFARMQDLELGETLEDGVTLGSYSEALNKVGINVLDANNNLRDMDRILDDIGERWNGLSAAQQTALAQSVAGVRQYSQFIALMDNWKGVQTNLEVANDSKGTLTEQQEIWASSWEAAASRVQNSVDQLYQSFVSDDFMITIADGFGKLINVLNRFIESSGGIGKVLLNFGAIFSTTLLPLLSNGITRIISHFKVLSGSAAQELIEMQQKFANVMQEMQNNPAFTEAFKAQLSVSQRLLEARQQLEISSKNLSEAQQAELQLRLNLSEQIGNEIIQLQEEKKANDELIESLNQTQLSRSNSKKIAQNQVINNFLNEDNNKFNTEEKAEIARYAVSTTKSQTEDQINEYENAKIRSEEILGLNTEETTPELSAEFEELQKIIKKYDNKIDKLKAVLDLQEKIAAQTKQMNSDGSNFSYGEASGFRDNEADDIAEVDKMTSGGKQQIKKELGLGEIPEGEDDSLVTVNATLENFDKLVEIRERYAAQAEDIKTNIAELETAASTLSKKLNEEGEQPQDNKTKKSKKKKDKTDKDSDKEINKATKQQKKDLEELQKTQEKSTKTVISLKKATLEQAKSLGVTQKELDELAKDFDEVEKDGAGAEDALKRITQKMKEMSQASRATSEGADELADSVKGTMAAGGQDLQKLDEREAALVRQAELTRKNAQMNNEFNNSLDDSQGPAIKAEGAFGRMMTGAASFAGSIAMAGSTIRNFWSTLTSEESTGFEKFISLMMMASTIIPVVTKTIKSLTASKKKNADTTKEGIVAEQAHSLAQKVSIAWSSALQAQEGKSTIVKYANAAAVVAQTVAETLLDAVRKMGWVGVTVGLAAVAALTYGYMEATKSVGELTQAEIDKNNAEIEAAKAAQEATDAYIEQSNTMSDLIYKYNKLKNAGEEFADVALDIQAHTKDLIQSYKDLAETLGITSTELDNYYDRIEEAAAAGDVTTVEEYTAKVDDKLMSEGAETAETGYKAATSNLANALVETNGSMSGNKYSVSAGGYNGLWGREEEQKIIDKLKKELDGTGIVTYSDSNDIEIQLDTADPDEFIKDYEALKKAVKAVEADSEITAQDRADSGVYEELKEILDNSEDAYNEAKSAQEKNQEYSFYRKKQKYEKDNGKKLSNVSNYKDYLDYKKGILDDSGMTEDEKKQAEEWLNNTEVGQQYEVINKKLTFAATNEKGEVDEEKLTNLQKVVSNFNAQQLEMLDQIDFTIFNSEDSLKMELERLQLVADSNAIEVNVKASEAALEKLSEDMSKEDWLAIKDSGITWGENGVMELLDFMRLGYEEQQKYLEDMTKGYGDKYYNSLKEQKEYLETSLEGLEEGSEEWKKYQELLDEVNFEIAISTGGKSKEITDEIKNNLQTISGLTRDIKIGDIISEEDYNKLIKLNPELKKYFAEVADGYKLISEVGQSEANTLGTSELGTTEDVWAKQKAARATKNKTGSFNVSLNDSGQTTIDNVDLETIASGTTENKLTDFGKSRSETLQLQSIAKAQGLYWQKTILQYFNTDEGRKQLEDLGLSYDRIQDVTSILWHSTDPEELKEAIATSEGFAKTISEANSGATDLVQITMNSASNISDLNSFIAKSEMQNHTISNDQKGQALTVLGANYASATNEIEEYNAALESGDEKRKAKAMKELEKAIKDAEWRKLAKDVNSYVKSLEGVTNPDEIAEGYQNIARSMNSVFDTKVTSSFVEQNYALFNEWANATGDRAVELALQIQSLGALYTIMSDSNTSDEDKKGLQSEISIDLNSDGVIEQYKGIQDFLNQNPLKIDSETGKVDLTSLLKILQTAKISAEGVAAILAGLGQTEITFGTGEDITNLDITNLDGLKEFLAKDISYTVLGGYVPSVDAVDMETVTNGSGDKKYTKTVDDYRERYKEIAQELGLIEKAMTRVAKQSERTWGKERLKLMDDEIELIKKQREQYQLQAQENEEYLKQDKADLLSAFNGMNLGFDIEIDEETGLITNIEDIQKAMFEKSKASNDSESWQEVEELWNKAFENYSGSLETKDELVDLIQESIWAEEDKILEKFNFEIEIRTTLNERDLKRIEYYLSKYEEDYEDFGKFWQYKQEEINKNTTELTDSYNDLLKLQQKWENGEITDQTAYQEKITELTGTVYDNLGAYQENLAFLRDEYSNQIEKMTEDINKLASSYDHVITKIEHYKQVMELTSQEFNYDLMGQLLDTQANTALSQAIFQGSQLAMYREELAKLEANHVEGNEASEKAIETMRQKVQEGEASALDSYTNYLSILQEKLENALSKADKTLENAFTNGVGFDQLDARFERAAASQEKWYTATNKIYETTKMIRNVQKEIDKTTSNTAKQRLKQFQTEIQMLQNQEKLSKHELDLQQKKYDLLLAELALEEAKNAVSAVTLRRDAEGNFGYVYTADQDKIADAQQNYDDAENALYNAQLEGLNGYAEKAKDVVAELSSALSDLNSRKNELTPEQYATERSEIIAFYKQQLLDYGELYNLSMEEMGAGTLMLEEAWSTGLINIDELISNYDANVTTYIDNVNTAYEDFSRHHENAKEQLEALIGMPLDLTPGNANEVLDGIATQTEEISKLWFGDPANPEDKGLMGKLIDGFEEVRTTIDAWAVLNAVDIKTIENKTDNILDKANEQATTEPEKKETPTEETPSEETTPETVAPSWENVSTIFENFNRGIWTETGGDKRKAKAISAGYSEEEVEMAMQMIKYIFGQGKSYDQAKALLGFDTGGYTGSWGPEGKLALLHEKELILDKDDTANFLRSLDFSNQMLDSIDRMANLMSVENYLQQVSAIFDKIGGMTDQIEQVVHIDAQFPNVHDSREIEDALNNLINTAAQYAYRD